MATVTLYRSVVSRVAMLPKKFSISAGTKKYDVHDDDDDQRQGDPVGGVVVLVVTRCSPSSSGSTCVGRGSGARCRR